MSELKHPDRDRDGAPAHKMVDLREAARKGVVTVDLGDVAPTRPTNLNPFETAKPSDPKLEPPAESNSAGTSVSENTKGE